MRPGEGPDDFLKYVRIDKTLEQIIHLEPLLECPWIKMILWFSAMSHVHRDFTNDEILNSYLETLNSLMFNC